MKFDRFDKNWLEGLKNNIGFLAINEGRKLAIEKTLRTCFLCKSGIENEFHFTMLCPFFNDIRAKYLPERFLQKQPIAAFVSLLSSKDDSVITSLSLYVYHAFVLRSELMDNM